MQVDQDLTRALNCRGCYVAIETNGTLHLPGFIDWIAVSPKPPSYTVDIDPLPSRVIDELRYVRTIGQGIPEDPPDADHYFISPAWAGCSYGNIEERLDQAVLDHCIQLVRDNPPWRLSVQQHKIWRVR